MYEHCACTAFVADWLITVTSCYLIFPRETNQMVLWLGQREARLFRSQNNLVRLKKIAGAECQNAEHPIILERPNIGQTLLTIGLSPHGGGLRWIDREEECQQEEEETREGGWGGKEVIVI